jgi:hypothetical protein
MRHAKLVVPLLCAIMAGCMGNEEKENRETLAMRHWQVLLATREIYEDLNPGAMAQVEALDAREPMSAGGVALLKKYLEQIDASRRKYIDACRRRFDATRCAVRADAIEADPRAALRIASEEGYDAVRGGTRSGNWLKAAAADLKLAPHWRAPPP